METSQRSKLYIIYVVTFLDLFAVSLAIPLIAPHLKEIGASHLVIGLSSTLYSVTQLISGPIVGGWSDRVGRCRILLFTMGICSICYLLLGSTQSMTVILLSRVVLGCFKHTQILCKTLVADVVPPSEHSGALGTLGAISGAGFVVGPAIGGHFAELPFGFMYVCWMVAAAFMLNGALVYAFLVDLDRGKAVRSAPSSSNSLDRLKVELDSVVLLFRRIDWNSYGDVFSLKLLLSLSNAFYYNNFSLSLQERFQLTPTTVGYLISFQSLIGSISGFLSSSITRLYTKMYGGRDVTQTRVIHAFGLLAFALLALWWSASPAMLVFLVAPIGASNAALRDLLTALLIRRSPVSQRGSMVGSAQSLSSMARMTAPLVAGFAVDSAGSAATVAMAQMAATAGLVLSMKMAKQPPKRRAH